MKVEQCWCSSREVRAPPRRRGAGPGVRPEALSDPSGAAQQQTQSRERGKSERRAVVSLRSFSVPADWLW